MTLKRILMLAAIVEILTGFALIGIPMRVVELLLGVWAPWTSIWIGRIAGVALLSLGVACWPGNDSGPQPAAWRGMLVYNALAAACFVYLVTVGKIGGILIWPAAVAHGVIALALVWTRRSSTATGARPSGG